MTSPRKVIASMSHFQKLHTDHNFNAHINTKPYNAPKNRTLSPPQTYPLPPKKKQKNVNCNLVASARHSLLQVSTKQDLNPSRSTCSSRSFPMKTNRLVRFLSPQGRSGVPSNNAWTPYNEHATPELAMSRLCMSQLRYVVVRHVMFG